jgi:RNA polymerase sigma-70 factor, ECF subfamily
MQNPSDRELALAAAAGRESAFKALIERHYDRIYKMAWQWTGTREAAEDIAQDVCVKLASAVRSFRAECKFTTWLYRVTYTATIDYLRMWQRRPQRETAEIIDLFGGQRAASPENDLLNRELWGKVRSLPPQQRDAVLLVYGQDLSHDEAAAILGCTGKTVSWHLHEARKRLKIQLVATG